MSKLFSGMMFAMFIALFGAPAAAAERGTLDEAKVMVKKARAYIREHGAEKAFAEISNPAGPFVKGDIYVYVYDKDLKNVAHGGNPRLIGKDLADMRDTDGKYINRGLHDVAVKGGGTFTFKFLNPATKSIENKTGYAEMEGDWMVGSGAYTAP